MNPDRAMKFADNPFCQRSLVIRGNAAQEHLVAEMRKLKLLLEELSALSSKSGASARDQSDASRVNSFKALAKAGRDFYARASTIASVE